MDANRVEVKRALELLFQPGDTSELRAFAAGKTFNGYYRNFDKLAADACELNSDQRVQAQCYVVLNPVLDALYSKRSDDTDYCGKGDGTADPQVACRRWLIIDCDCSKPDKGVSASDTERQAAEQLTQQVYRYLVEQCGWPAPAVASSGNGYWLLFRLPELPNNGDTRWVLRQLLVHLSEQFDSESAVVDRTTFSAAQLVKLLGTVARKGSDTVERPHRLSKLLSVPDPIRPVTWEQLTAVTGQPQESPQPVQQATSNGSWDIEQLLCQRQIAYSRDDQYHTADGSVGVRWELEQCPWEPEHQGSAYVIQFASGAVAAGCLGNRCADKDWSDLKQIWQLPASGADLTAEVLASLGGQQQLQAAPAELLVVSSRDVQPEQIGWLWQERVVIGGINLFCGRGGIGKTYFLCDLVARVTNDVLPAPNGQPLLHGRVLYSTGEDHLAKIIEPRMQAHGANRDRLEYIKGLPAGQYLRLLDVIEHCDLLRDLLQKRPDTIALVLDPISSFQGQADSNKVAQVRRFTAVLTQLSEEFNIAVLGIHHFNKGRREVAGDSISGSHAYRDAARAAWLFALDGDDPARRLMVCDKNNWAEQRPPGLAYRIEQGRICYEAEPLDMTSDELLGQSAGQQPLDVACAWLLAQLSAGQQPATNMQIAATIEGIAERTLKRARKRLGIVATKVGDHWLWSLPTDGAAATTQMKEANS